MIDVPDEITTRILYAASTLVAADLAVDGIDPSTLGDIELGARLAEALDDTAIIAIGVSLDPTGANLAPAARQIADRALMGARTMAVAA